MTRPRRGAGVDGGSTRRHDRAVARARTRVDRRRPLPSPPPLLSIRPLARLLALAAAAAFLVPAAALPAAAAGFGDAGFTSGARFVAAEDPVVVGDDERDVFVGHGGLLLPPTFHGSAGGRGAAATCAGCSWRLTEACLRDAGGSCTGFVSMCPPGELYLRVWLLDPASGGGWTRIGAVCLGPRGPVTVADMGAAARDAFVRDLPALAPAAQPARTAVTQIPVVLRSGQPATWPDRSYDLLGFRVTVHATPRWTWWFGDGAALTTEDPGGSWPDDGVAHTYRQVGRWQVRVATVWSATWTTDGLGPFDVAGPVRQDAVLPVPVGQGRAVLVGGG